MITGDQVIARDWLRTAKFDRTHVSHVGLAPFEPRCSAFGTQPFVYVPYIVVDGNRYDCRQLRDLKPLALRRAQRMAPALERPGVSEVP